MEFLQVGNQSENPLLDNYSSNISVSGGSGNKALNPFRRGTIMGGKKGLVKSSSEALW